MAKRRLIAEEMRKEYDFSKGIRGRYARRFAEGTNVMVLDAEHALSRRSTSKRARKA